MAVGEEDEGAAMLREAIEISARSTMQQQLGTSYNNLAEGLHLAGRSEEGLAVALEGRERIEGANRSQGWLSLQARRSCSTSGASTRRRR